MEAEKYLSLNLCSLRLLISKMFHLIDSRLADKQVEYLLSESEHETCEPIKEHRPGHRHLGK